MPKAREAHTLENLVTHRCKTIWLSRDRPSLLMHLPTSVLRVREMHPIPWKMRQKHHYHHPQSPRSFRSAPSIANSGLTRFSMHAQSIRLVFSANQIWREVRDSRTTGGPLVAILGAEQNECGLLVRKRITIGKSLILDIQLMVNWSCQIRYPPTSITWLYAGSGYWGAHETHVLFEIDHWPGEIP